MCDTSPSGAWATASRGEKIQDAIARTLPSGPREREHRLLELVRALRPLIATAEDAEPHVRQWWEHAFPQIRTKAWHKTWGAFRRAWQNFDPRADALERSIVLARAGDAPPEVTGAGYADRIVLLAGICRELQRHAGPGRPFFLSCHCAARALDVPHAKQAMRWLHALRKDGLLRLERRGRHSLDPSNRRASEWRWEGVL